MVHSLETVLTKRRQSDRKSKKKIRFIRILRAPLVMFGREDGLGGQSPRHSGAEPMDRIHRACERDADPMSVLSFLYADACRGYSKNLLQA